MERGPNILLAVAVLALGLTTAMLFRQRGGETPPEARAGSGDLVLREQIAPPQARAAYPRTIIPPAGSTEPAEGESRSPGSVADPDTPLEPADPPNLSRSYPFLPGLRAAEIPARRGMWHVIEDGDTLESLAERYLGSAGRADELYEANRELLPRPDVLPIGVELVIPRTGREAQPRQPGSLVPHSRQP